MKKEHPAAELLEKFAMRRLAAEPTTEVVRHLKTCERCRAALSAEYEFIAAIREALTGEPNWPPRRRRGS